jgi:hypothetical protein
MSAPTRCPCCGTELTPEVVAARARSSVISNSWETLRSEVQPPGSIAELLEGPGERGATWWLPSLAYLAYDMTDRIDARAVLDEFASRRDELGYAVVEEETDEVIGLTVQPWPLVDEQGRLRFPISSDPLQLAVRAPELAEVLRADRQRWHALGLLQEELLARRVQIGDTYAVVVASRPAKSRLKTLRHTAETRPRYLGGLLARRTTGSVAVPIVDVTWDAREAGKVAHYAAAAGVIPDQPDPATAPVAEETEARYMIGFRDGVDPRDVTLSPETSA